MAKQTWFWLADGLGYGAVNVGELLSAYPGGAEEIANDLGGSRLDEIITQKQAERLASTRPADFALRIAHYESMGINCLAYDDADYPDMLRRSTNPPPVLFLKGDASLLNGQLTVGMVGARRPTAYGVEAAKAIGRGVALGGAIIVSGLAAGLDSEAHKAALAVNGPTIACIAFGHDHCYPAANKKLMELIERYGAVISEYPPGTQPAKPFFLQRNRLIAAMGHGLVVIEARKHSGTMSTVNFATEYGRDVFAVPGSIFSELSGGTNGMISEGAYVASSASDVLNVYGVELKEDPIGEMAEKQAKSGRPAAAEAAPIWQVPERLPLTRDAETAPQPALPAQPAQVAPTPQIETEDLEHKTLGEILRAQVAGTADGEPISPAQAAAAFMAIQKKMDGGTGESSEERSRALEEMATAVNDLVDIGGEPQDLPNPPQALSMQAEQPPAPPTQQPQQSRQSQPPQRRQPQQKTAGAKSQKVEPFQWSRVEQLEKHEVEDLSPAKDAVRETAAGGKPSLAARIFNPSPKQGKPAQAAAQQQPQPRPRTTYTPTEVHAAAQPAPRRVAQQPPAQYGKSTAPIGRVGAVPAVGSVEPVYGVPPAQAAQVVRAANQAQEAQTAPVQQQTTQLAFGDMPKAAQAVPEVPEVPVSQLAQQQRPAVPPIVHRAPETAAEQPQAQPMFPPEPPKEKKLQRERLQGQPRPKKQDDDPNELSSTGKRALAVLGAVPLSLDILCKRSGLSSAEAMAALTELELSGLSRQLPGRQFVRADGV